MEQAVIAGTKANIPVMVDFGADRPTRPLYDLLTQKLRPGDIYTHMYSGLRHEQDPVTKGPQKGMIEGRARGIYFDAGTGGGSFKWSLAVPFIQQGFKPDSLSTDLHVDSMNSATKDMLNVASKFMAMGLSAVGSRGRDDVASRRRKSAARTWATCRWARWPMSRCCGWKRASSASQTWSTPAWTATRSWWTRLTIKDGKIVYDLNGMEALRPGPRRKATSANDRRWTSWPRPKPRPDDGVKLH